MMPRANRESRDSPPPENRLRKPRMFDPPKFFWMSLTAVVLTPGTGMCEPSRYRARIAAVNSSFLRMSGTVKALRIVRATAPQVSRGPRSPRQARQPGRGLLDDLAGAAGGLD